VIGVDPDERLIEQAKKLDREAGITVTYMDATAETTSLDSEIAEVITAGQCWHWFDRPRAIVEAIRVLQPKGALVIAHFDWLPLTGNVVEATERLIERHNPNWDMGGGLGMYPQWLPELSVAGFLGIETFSYDVDVPYTPTAWRGRIRASAGVTALGAEAASDFDSDLAALLTGEFPFEVLSVPHRVFAIIAERPQ
jgi:SAM-dependent methyltransferase